MVRGSKTPEESLLDWHLDQLGEEERSQIEAAMESDAELHAKSETLERILKRMGQWTAPKPPADLSDKVLRRVAEAKTNRVIPMPPQSEPAAPVRSPFSLRELVAVAACLVLMMGILMPGLSGMRGRAHRRQCARNLAAVGRAVNTYQGVFSGSLPYAGRAPGTSWLRGGPENMPYASNSRHMQLLIGRFGMASGQFVCPACQWAGSPTSDPEASNNFVGARHVCYDSLNLSGPAPNLRPRKPMAYMSDRNPLFITDRFNWTIDPRQTNAPTHEYAGQNVLMLDGNVQWTSSPNCGPEADNLWTAKGISSYNGTEAQTDDDDAFLIPGAPTRR